MIFQDIFAVSPFRLCVTTTEAKRIATYNVAIQKLLLIRGVGWGGGKQHPGVVTKILQIHRKIIMFEVSENNKAIRNAVLWGAHWGAPGDVVPHHLLWFHHYYCDINASQQCLVQIVCIETYHTSLTTAKFYILLLVLVQLVKHERRFRKNKFHNSVK